MWKVVSPPNVKKMSTLNVKKFWSVGLPVRWSIWPIWLPGLVSLFDMFVFRGSTFQNKKNPGKCHVIFLSECGFCVRFFGVNIKKIRSFQNSGKLYDLRRILFNFDPGWWRSTPGRHIDLIGWVSIIKDGEMSWSLNNCFTRWLEGGFWPCIP